VFELVRRLAAPSELHLAQQLVLQLVFELVRRLASPWELHLALQSAQRLALQSAQSKPRTCAGMQFARCQDCTHS